MVAGALALTVVCLVLAARGAVWALVVALVCAATAVREVRALRRLDRDAGRTARPGTARRARPARTRPSVRP